MQSLTCPKCQTSNRRRQNFCKHCGAVLMAACRAARLTCRKRIFVIMRPPAGGRRWFALWQNPDAASGAHHRWTKPGRRVQVPQWSLSPKLSAMRLSYRRARQPRLCRCTRLVAPREIGQCQGPLPRSHQDQATSAPQYNPKSAHEARLARAAARWSASGRVVTMLFCDVFGSTAVLSSSTLRSGRILTRLRNHDPARVPMRTWRA